MSVNVSVSSNGVDFSDVDKSLAFEFISMQLSISDMFLGLVLWKGDQVQLQGGFMENATFCKFGSTLVEAIVSSSESLSCFAPAHGMSSKESLTMPVYITMNELYSFNAFAFTFHRMPNVLSISPSSGSEMGDNEVFITGIGFINSVDLTCRFSSASSLIDMNGLGLGGAYHVQGSKAFPWDVTCFGIF